MLFFHDHALVLTESSAFHVHFSRFLITVIKEKSLSYYSLKMTSSLLFYILTRI
jgi:hypothetical protein